MAKSYRRLRNAIAFGGLMAATLSVPQQGLASTMTPPAVDTSGSVTVESWWIVPATVAIGVVAAILIAVARPAARRPLVAVGVFVAVGLVGTFFVLGGLLSDFSGQHRVAWLVVAIGACLIGAGAVAALRVSGHRAPR